MVYTVRQVGDTAAAERTFKQLEDLIGPSSEDIAAQVRGGGARGVWVHGPRVAHPSHAVVSTPKPLCPVVLREGRQH